MGTNLKIAISWHGRIENSGANFYSYVYCAIYVYVCKNLGHKMYFEHVEYISTYRVQLFLLCYVNYIKESAFKVLKISVVEKNIFIKI